MVQAGNKWFICRGPQPQASQRLFCFPFGGGGASVFHSWASAMGAGVEVRALQLPGREARFNEPTEKNFDTLVNHIVAAIGPHLDKPFSFFGYSLGSLLAFEVCRELRRRNMRLPEQLFIAALAAPQLPPSHPPISMLHDQEFVDKVEYYYQPGGEAWDNLELREFLLPILRDDITAYESYTYREAPPLDCPIHVFAGDSDRATPLDSTHDWSAQTTSEMKHHVMPGGHFFIDNSLSEIQAIVSARLNRR